jgi:hypothetical protein
MQWQANSPSAENERSVGIAAMSFPLKPANSSAGSTPHEDGGPRTGRDWVAGTAKSSPK